MRPILFIIVFFLPWTTANAVEIPGFTGDVKVKYKEWFTATMNDGSRQVALYSQPYSTKLLLDTDASVLGITLTHDAIKLPPDKVVGIIYVVLDKNPSFYYGLSAEKTIRAKVDKYNAQEIHVLGQELTKRTENSKYYQELRLLISCSFVRQMAIGHEILIGLKDETITASLRGSNVALRKATPTCFSDRLSKASGSDFLDEFQSMIIAVQLRKPISSENYAKFPKDYRQFLYLLKLKLDNFTTTANYYEKLVSSDRFQNLLAPKVLNQAQGQSEIINFYTANLQNLRTAVDAYYKGFPQQVELLDIDPVFKQSMQTGWNKTSKKVSLTWDRYLANQEEILAVIKSIYQLCSRNTTRYQSSTNQILFSSKEVLATYNSLILKVSSLAVEESKISADFAEMFRIGIGIFKKQRETSGLL